MKDDEGEGAAVHSLMAVVRERRYLEEIDLSGSKVSIQEVLRRNVKRFRGGLVLKAHRLVYHSRLSSRVKKKKKQKKKEKQGRAPPPKRLHVNLAHKKESPPRPLR